MSFSRYPEYKDSGFEWLGEVPAHWKLHKVAWHVPYSVGWTPATGRDEFYDGDNLWVTIADMDVSPIKDTRTKITELAVSEKRASPSPAGSLLFSFKLTVGAVAFLARSAFTNEAIASFRPNVCVDLNYWKYAAPQFIPKNARENIYGALLLNQELIGGVRFYAPAPDEQRLIAAFLDHETEKIHALIEEQKRLIELLKEKRQAVISQAVTMGLDPSVPMKDSSVEWLGEVPAHWSVGALRWYAKIQGGLAKGKDYRGQETLTMPYLRVANVQDGYVDLSDVKEVEILAGEVNRYLLRNGDVLMNEGGDNDKLGRGAVWRSQIDPCLHQNHVFAIRPDGRLIPEWLALFTQSYQARFYFFINSKQSTNLASISSRNIMGSILPIPPIDEQIRIVDFALNKSQAFDLMIQEAGKSIALLQERCSALISATVTGKIDVRGWQPTEAFCYAKTSEEERETA